MLDAILTVPFDDKARQLMITRHFLKPLAEIKSYNDLVGAGDIDGLKDLPKYRLFSAHDTNIANILKVIKPDLMPSSDQSDQLYRYIPYAANIYVEAYMEQSDE